MCAKADVLTDSRPSWSPWSRGPQNDPAILLSSSPPVSSKAISNLHSTWALEAVTSTSPRCTLRKWPCLLLHRSARMLLTSCLPPNSPASVSFLLPPPLKPIGTAAQDSFDFLGTSSTHLILFHALTLASLPAPSHHHLNAPTLYNLEKNQVLLQTSCSITLLLLSQASGDISLIFTNSGLLPHTPWEIPLATVTSKVLAAKLHQHISDHASLALVEHPPSASYGHTHSWCSYLARQSFPLPSIPAFQTVKSSTYIRKST